MKERKDPFKERELRNKEAMEKGEMFTIRDGQKVFPPKPDERVSEEELQKRAACYFAACKKTGYPKFAPASGKCYRCNINIFHHYSGNSPEITGCPYCSTSYCD